MVPAGAGRTPRSAAGAYRPERFLVHNPAHYVESVNVLLCNNVTGQYPVKSPRPQPILRILRVFLPGLVHTPERTTCMVNRLAKYKLAKGAVASKFNRFKVKLGGTGLKIHKKTQFFSGSFPAAVTDTVAAGHIHSNRLGNIDVAAGIPGHGGPRRGRTKERPQ